MSRSNCLMYTLLFLHHHSQPLLFQFLDLSLEKHLFQPEIEPVEKDLVSLTDHVALGPHREGLLGVNGRQLRKFLGIVEGLHIVGDPDIGRSIFNLQGNLFILVMAKDGGLFEQRGKISVIDACITFK